MATSAGSITSPVKRKQSPKVWKKAITAEYESAPKITIDNVVCAVRNTGNAWMPHQIIRPKGESFEILEAWAADANTFEVRQKYDKTVLARLNASLEQIQPNEITYEEAAREFKTVEELLASPLPPIEQQNILARRKSLQRQMSALSWSQVYLSGMAALEDGIEDYKLFSAHLRIKTLERLLLKESLSKQERDNVTEILLPNSKRSFIARTQYLVRNGKISLLEVKA
jgi:hypothetical protein